MPWNVLRQEPTKMKTKQTVRLVFNADDFGMSVPANRAILEAYGCGLMKSASLMVVHPFAEQAAVAASAASAESTSATFKESGPSSPLGLGLHFCLTSGLAVAPASEVPLLVDGDGRLKWGFLGLRALLRSVRRADAIRQIETEFQAQMERFDHIVTKAPNCLVDHLDSHQHIHVFPEIFPFLAREAARRNLVLRIPHERIGSLCRFVQGSPVFHAKGVVKKMILDHYLKTSRKLMVQGNTFPCGYPGSAPLYFGIVDSGRMVRSTVLEIVRILPKLARRTNSWHAEVNLHPWCPESDAVPDAASPADRVFAMSAQRERELEVVTKHYPEIQGEMARCGIMPDLFASFL